MQVHLQPQLQLPDADERGNGRMNSRGDFGKDLPSSPRKSAQFSAFIRVSQLCGSEVPQQY